MGRAKSFRKRCRDFFCCFQTNVENVDVISPTPRLDNPTMENLNVMNENEQVENPKIRVGYRIEKIPGKGSVIFVFQANENEGSIFEFDQHGDDAVTGCGIGGQGIKYLDKGDDMKAINMLSYSKLPAPIYQRRQDGNSVNAWSRHLSSSNTRPLYANVNLTKGIVPSLNNPSKISAYRNVMMSWSEQQIHTRPKCARGRKSDHVATKEARPADEEKDNDYVNPYCLLIV